MVNSSILAWKILWTEEPGGLQSMGMWSWTRLSTCAHTRTHTHTHTHSILPLKHPKLQSKHENIRSPKSDILQNIRPVLLHTVKAIRNKENLRHCPSQEEPEETGQLHVMGPCKARINQVKIKEMLIKGKYGCGRQEPSVLASQFSCKSKTILKEKFT